MKIIGKGKSNGSSTQDAAKRQCDNAVATYRLAFLIIFDIVSKKQDGDWSRCRGVPESMK